MPIIYIFILALIYIFAIFICVYLISGVYSMLKGAPYVPTNSKIIWQIFNQIRLKKDSHIVELGSGDGRVLRIVVGRYCRTGTGYEINPILILLSKLYKRLYGALNIIYIREDFMKADLSQADVIYFFLLPNTIRKITPKLLTETKKNAIIISHGFKIKEFKKFLIKKYTHEPFSTYYYQVTNV